MATTEPSQPKMKPGTLRRIAGVIVLSGPCIVLAMLLHASTKTLGAEQAVVEAATTGSGIIVILTIIGYGVSLFEPVTIVNVRQPDAE